MVSRKEKRRNDDARSYNIYNAMQCPKQIGSANKVRFSRVVDTIGNNLQSYVSGYPFSGVHGDMKRGETDRNGFYLGPDLALGSNFFVDLGRRCDEQTSSPECRGEPAHTYVRNVPTGKIPFFGNVSFNGLTGCEIRGLTEGRGLIPGILEDLSDVSPWALSDALQGNGNVLGTKCKTVRLPVGTHIYDRKMKGKTWDFQKRCSNSLFYYKDGKAGQVEHVPGARGPFDAPNAGPYRENFRAEKDAARAEREVRGETTAAAVFARDAWPRLVAVGGALLLVAAALVFVFQTQKKRGT